MSNAHNPDNTRPGLSYKDAGVDIDAGNRLVESIKAVTSRTHRPEVLSGLGGFGALCEIPAGYRQPVLVSATDGVGTKLKLAINAGHHDTVGIDLVAMCVNDLIVCGAEPLFFLDYYATGGLDVDVATSVVTGIGTGCELAGCALIGGETAEMPGMYQAGDYDLAGFAVGVVEKSAIIDNTQVSDGDVLLALRSSGAHSNGYSLIRKVLEVSGASLDDRFEEGSLGEALLRPTEIYVRAIRALAGQTPLHALAHITGGGLPENLPRVLPAGVEAVINSNSWQWPAIFQWLQQQGNISDSEMYRTFNCGVGMVVCVPQSHADSALQLLSSHNLGAFRLGQVRNMADRNAAARVVFEAESEA